jgi:alpha-glucosidase
VLLMLAPGDSRLEWTGYDEAGDAWPDPAQPPMWQTTIRTSATTIDIQAAWHGTGSAPSPVLSFAVPEREQRTITVNGTTLPLRSAQVLGLQRKVVDWRV